MIQGLILDMLSHAPKHGELNSTQRSHHIGGFKWIQGIEGLKIQFNCVSWMEQLDPRDPHVDSSDVPKVPKKR